MNDHPFEVGIDENGDEYYISKGRWGMMLNDHPKISKASVMYQPITQTELDRMAQLHDILNRRVATIAECEELIALTRRSIDHIYAARDFLGITDPNFRRESVEQAHVIISGLQRHIETLSSEINE